MRKSPEEAAEIALNRVMEKLEKKRKEVKELETVVARLSGVLKPVAPLPPHLKLTIPEFQKEVPQVPHPDLADGDTEEGRWC